MELDLFPFSCEGKEITTLLCPLDRANLNHFSTDVQKLKL
jgi:hypothetical protein